MTGIVAPYGLWPSPISPPLVASARVAYDEVEITDRGV